MREEGGREEGGREEGREGRRKEGGGREEGTKGLGRVTHKPREVTNVHHRQYSQQNSD